jgi:hypothetical protein
MAHLPSCVRPGRRLASEDRRRPRAQRAALLHPEIHRLADVLLLELLDLPRLVGLEGGELGHLQLLERLELALLLAGQVEALAGPFVDGR